MIRKMTRFRCVAQRGWYFMTREGRVGPFDTRREAVQRCQDYIHEMIATPIGQREEFKFRKIA